MNRTDSVFLFNMGIHYSLVLSFAQYQELVNSVVKLLKETKEDGRTPKYKAQIIWRGTTMIEREKLVHEPWPAMKHNTPLFRFHTNQVRSNMINDNNNNNINNNNGIYSSIFTECLFICWNPSY